MAKLCTYFQIKLEFCCKKRFKYLLHTQKVNGFEWSIYTNIHWCLPLVNNGNVSLKLFTMKCNVTGKMLPPLIKRSKVRLTSDVCIYVCVYIHIEKNKGNSRIPWHIFLNFTIFNVQFQESTRVLGVLFQCRKLINDTFIVNSGKGKIQLKFK